MKMYFTLLLAGIIRFSATAQDCTDLRSKTNSLKVGSTLLCTTSEGIKIYADKSAQGGLTYKALDKKGAVLKSRLERAPESTTGTLKKKAGNVILGCKFCVVYIDAGGHQKERCVVVKCSDRTNQMSL